VVLGTLENRLEARLQEDIALIARTLKGPMSRALDRERDGAVERALRSAFDFGRVYGVYVYDADGHLMTRADRLDRHARPSTAAVQPVAPEPAKGSSAVPPRAVVSRTSQRISACGLTVG